MVGVVIAELLAFVKARLDDDTAIALAASPGPWHLNAERTEVIAVDEEPVAEAFALGSNQLRATAEHIARHDPTRVLREVEARRRVVARHQLERRWDGDAICGRCSVPQAGAYQTWPCPDLRDLASAWSTHPDYRAEWAPDVDA